MKKIAGFIHSFFIVIGITTVLFIAINLAAIRFIPAPANSELPKADLILNHGHYPSTEEGQNVLKQYFGKDFAQDVHDAMSKESPTPAFSAHPVLHYIVTPTDNRFYHVGIEGMRYDEGITDESAINLLRTSKHKIFMFGGSTTFGYGLSSNQTIQHYLQSKYSGTDTVVFNFGANAYDQQREIDKLVYLLEHDYIPDEVIFFDGVNDITHMAASNYRAGDKIIYHGFVSGRSRSENPDDNFTVPSPTPRKLGLKDYLILQTRAIPVIRAFIQDSIQSANKFDDASFPDELDPFKTKLNIKMAEFAFFHWGIIGDNHLELKKKEMLEYYKHNQSFLEHLASGYGFKLHLFFQPMGMLDPNNPMVPAMDSKVPGYRYYHEMVPFVREHIASGELHMIDLSDVLVDISKKHLAYVDPMHYSPQANQLFAELFFKQLTTVPTKKE